MQNLQIQYNTQKVRKFLSLCLWHVFNTNMQRFGQLKLEYCIELLYVLEALYKQVAVGSIDSFGFWRITGKNYTNFYRIYFLLIWGV